MIKKIKDIIKELTKEEQDRHVRVSNMFGAFDKLIRGMKLYEGKGPLVEKLLAQAAFFCALIGWSSALY